MRELGPFEELLLRIAVDSGIAFDPRPPEIDAALSWLAQSVDLLAARLPESQQRHWLAAALTALSHQVQMSTLSDPPPLGRRLAVGPRGDHQPARTAQGEPAARCLLRRTPAVDGPRWTGRCGPDRRPCSGKIEPDETAISTPGVPSESGRKMDRLLILRRNRP
jgi:hypothetical protein